MSLSYEFDKSIILGLIATTITLIIGLIILLNPFAHGQNMTFLQLQQQVQQLQQQQKSLEALLNYCFQHADRPNPIQDLIDKGFLSAAFKGETCISIRQQYDKLGNILAIQEAKKEKESLAYKAMLTNERNKKMNTTEKYAECARNFSKTQEECNRIPEGIK